MAVDMFLKIADVDGESVDSTHKNEIDVLAWSWGASQSGTMHMGGGGGSGKVSIQDLSITKYTDKASMVLFEKCCDGSHIAEAVLVVRKAGGKSPVEYVKITMKDVIITSISFGGSGGEDRLTENVSLNFAKVTTVYTPQDKAGTAQPAVQAGWNIEENVPAS